MSEWLDSRSNKNTRKVYRAAMLEFLDFIYGRVRKGVKATKKEFETYEKLAERYIEECKKGRKYLQDLLRFAGHLKSRPPLSAKVFYNGVKEFLFFYGFELRVTETRRIVKALPKGKRRTVESELNRETLQKILNQMDLKGKALFLFLASSGCRIGEALKLTLDDIKLEKDPVEVTVRGEYTKSGETRTTYISKEAKTTLLEWLKVRDRWLESSVNKNRGLRQSGRSGEKVVDDRVFPFSFGVVDAVWRNALTKSGLYKVDKSTNRKTLHPHMLRKWFLSQSKLVIPVEISEALAGHSGYLSDAYRRYSKDQIRDYYLKAEPYLFVFVPREISEIQTHFNRELEEQKERVNKLTEQLNDTLVIVQKLRVERDELAKQVREYEETISVLSEAVSALSEEIAEIKTTLLEKTKTKI
ncbi:MAG: tyrosine-type recombinase/integrase [Candidatus Freyarchaeota archaeon]